jgi:hypothetical protein
VGNKPVLFQIAQGCAGFRTFIIKGMMDFFHAESGKSALHWS